MKRLIVLMVSLLSVSVLSYAQDKQPDLNTLRNSGFIMAPGSGSYQIHDTWRSYTKVMASADMFDGIVDEIDRVVCGADQNKSILIVGEPDNFYKYIFARIAMRPNSPCATLWHVEVDINKIESGHRYVGEVDEYWRENVLAPSEGKSVVLYFNNLGAIIGLGSHSNDNTGIEQEYSSNISSGKMRSVAFINKFEYNEVMNSRNAYVLESFANKVILPSVTEQQAGALARVYLQALYPFVKLGDQELNYLLKNSNFYMPNRNEPERSIAIINKVTRSLGDGARELKPYIANIETAHPYLPNTKTTWTVDADDANEIQLSFDMFDLEQNYDTLTIKDNKGKTLDILSGNKGAFKTRFYPANHLILEFSADSEGSLQGFKISTYTTAKYKEYKITMGDLRKAIMEIAQVPKWLMERDYSIIKNLRSQLDSDVVGVAEGKEDLVRLAKNGYVAGRTDDKPVGTIMFTGPTGTGKSYIAKKMADFTGQKLITFDMTSYKEVDSFKTFQEVLARSLTNNPYAIYLFEEIDKAAVEVLDQLYFMMDEGIFYDQFQRPLFARGAFLIFTTNAASDTILNNPKAPELRKMVMTDLQKSFRMSFLNRFDAISIFLPFTQDEYVKLAKTLADKKISKIKEYYEWTVTVDQGTYNYIATYGQSAVFGARPMERLVESVMGAGIAEYQLNKGNIPDLAKLDFKKLAGAHDFRLSVNNDKIDFVVNPGNNSVRAPMLLSNSSKKGKVDLESFFASIRMYED